MRYPHKCVRCGYCCTFEPCPVIKKVMPGVKKCPVFELGDNGQSVCRLANFLVPIGDGCCIKARCFRGDTVYDFAALPGEVKRALAINLYERRF